MTKRQRAQKFLNDIADSATKHFGSKAVAELKCEIRSKKGKKTVTVLTSKESKR